MTLPNQHLKDFVTAVTKKTVEKVARVAQEKKVSIPVITVCTEPGSGGHLIAAEVAKELNLNLYDKELLTLMANMANVDRAKLNEIEKERPDNVHDLLTCLLDNKYVSKESYFSDLKQAIELIAVTGKCIIIGRGANFILPPRGRFSIRVIAPLDVRIRNVAFRYGVSLVEAEKRIKNRENRRKEFIKTNFHQQIEDVSHYDMIINTGRMDVETSVETIIGAVVGSQVNNAFGKDVCYVLRNGK